MERLTIEPLINFSELQSFECGIEEMDNFIHNGLYQSVQNCYCRMYAVHDANNVLIAFFALSFDSLRLDTDDIEDLQNGWTDTTIPCPTQDYLDTFWSKVHYPALEIAYLAVHKDYRNQHIGKTIIAEIEKMAHNQQLAGCQFLTVGAYVSKEYNAIGFYTKCGFAKAEPVPVRDTLRMYYNLLN